MNLSFQTSMAPENPVGKPTLKTEISEFVEGLKTKWTESKKELTSLKKLSIQYATKFMILALDSLILFVDSILGDESGANKKATVLVALSLVYDFVIKEILPVWLRPFASKIKLFVINVVASIAIDWIVSNYRNGIWKNE